MSQRRGAAHSVIPDNPEWIVFSRSDGDSKLLPKNTERIVDSEGQVNYMRPCGLEDGGCINWRVGIGAQIAALLDYPKGPNYVLKDWPQGYHLYDHNKGPAASPRHDFYLCGSTLVNRFRSMNEFTPHAVWLLTDETKDRANCGCKYCTKKPQRVITEVLELPSGPRRTSSLPGSPSKSIRRHREIRKPKPYAQVRRAPKPVKPPRAGPDQTLAPEHDSDIRHLLVTGRSGASRWHRKGELVWCALNPPIQGETDDDSIHFWPGIVERVDVHADLLQGENAVDDGRLPEPQTRPLEPGPSDGEGSQLVADDASAKPLWDVRQWYTYNVKLLAVTHACAASDSEVLPYLAYTPPEQLLMRMQDLLPQIMRSKPAAEMEADLKHAFAFDPFARAPQADGPAMAPDLARHREAVAPFALAVQIASNVAAFWSPTDEWDCKFSVPLDDPQPAPAPGPDGDTSAPSPQLDAGLTLHALMNQAAENNAVEVARRATAQHTSPEGAYRPADVSDADFEDMRTRMLGHHLGGSKIVSQTRYQGLWWGAERIWTDELVRLKLARCQFAPAGTDIFYPPAGPSASVRAHAAESGYGDDESSMGAREKGLFMLLEGIFVVDVPKEDGSGMTKECRACGQLYELADEDWEDPMEAIQSAAQPNGGGKGKEKERASDSSAPMTTVDAVPPQGPSGPSFMPGPSPLKPPPLPNPDPTVSVADTAKAAIAQTTQGLGKSSTRTVGGQLSHPADSVPYPLPRAPKGFKFRRIHPPGHEVVLSLPLISGRYYPRLLEHPLMQPVVQKAFEVPPEEGGLDKSRHIWAMEGLVAGVYQSMESTVWKPSRPAMYKDADTDSRQHFSNLWEEVKDSEVPRDLSQYLDMDVEMQ